MTITPSYKALRNTLISAFACGGGLALVMAWAVEQRFDMPVWDALRVLFS